MSACSYCQKEGRLAARGLCGTCYARYQRNGTAEHVRPNRSLGLTECSYCRSDKKPFIKSLCRACYQRQYTSGSLELQRTINLCQAENCDDPVAAHGLCARHAQRVRRHGDVNAGRSINWGSHRSHSLYERWRSMRRGSRSRGGHDPRWDDFGVFLDEMGECPDGYRLRRLDKTKPYRRDNCEWAPIVLVNSQSEREKKNEYMRTYLAKRPEVLRRSHRKTTYGITDNWYEVTLAAQGNVCSICKRPETQKHTRTGDLIALAVDHDKDSGQKRGILCGMCNKGIGNLRHSIDLLRAAIAYLEKHAVE